MKKTIKYSAGFFNFRDWWVNISLLNKNSFLNLINNCFTLPNLSPALAGASINSDSINLQEFIMLFSKSEDEEESQLTSRHRQRQPVFPEREASLPKKVFDHPPIKHSVFKEDKKKLKDEFENQSVFKEEDDTKKALNSEKRSYTKNKINSNYEEDVIKKENDKTKSQTSSKKDFNNTDTEKKQDGWVSINKESDEHKKEEAKEAKNKEKPEISTKKPSLSGGSKNPYEEESATSRFDFKKLDPYLDARTFARGKGKPDKLVAKSKQAERGEIDQEEIRKNFQERKKAIYKVGGKKSTTEDSKNQVGLSKEKRKDAYSQSKKANEDEKTDKSLFSEDLSTEDVISKENNLPGEKEVELEEAHLSYGDDEQTNPLPLSSDFESRDEEESIVSSKQGQWGREIFFDDEDDDLHEDSKKTKKSKIKPFGLSDEELSDAEKFIDENTETSSKQEENQELSENKPDTANEFEDKNGLDLIEKALLELKEYEEKDVEQLDEQESVKVSSQKEPYNEKQEQDEKSTLEEEGSRDFSYKPSDKEKDYLPLGDSYEKQEQEELRQTESGTFFDKKENYAEEYTDTSDSFLNNIEPSIGTAEEAFRKRQKLHPDTSNEEFTRDITTKEDVPLIQEDLEEDEGGTKNKIKNFFKQKKWKKKKNQGIYSMKNKNKKIASLPDLSAKKARIGVDVGHSNVKCVVLEQVGGSYIIKAKEEYPVPEDSNEIDPTWLSGIIENFSRSVGLRRAGVYITFPNIVPQIAFRFFQMPLVSQKELNRGIENEIQEMTLVDSDDIFSRWSVIEEGNENCDIIATTAERNIMTNLKKASSSRFPIKGLELSPVSIGRLLDEDVAVIDFGHVGTRLMAYKKGMLVYSQAIEIGGKSFTDIVSKRYPEDAEEIKKQKGIISSDRTSIQDPVSAEICDLLYEVTANLAEDLKRGFEEAETKFENRLDKVYYTGNGARMRLLTDFLSRELERDLNPLNLTEDTDIISEDYSFVSAAGVWLQKAYPYLSDLDFSKVRSPKKSLDSKSIFMTVLGIVLALQMGMFILNYSSGRELASLETRQATLNEEVRTLQEDVTFTQGQISGYESIAQGLEDMERDYRGQGWILHELLNRTPRDVAIRDLYVEKDMIVLDGVSRTYGEIGAMAISLESLGDTRIEELSKDGDIRRFVIVLRPHQY